MAEYLNSYLNKICSHAYIVTSSPRKFRERQQLGFVTLNDDSTINLKPTHPPFLNSKGQLTFSKTKSSHSLALLCTHQNLNFLEINSFW